MISLASMMVSLTLPLGADAARVLSAADAACRAARVVRYHARYEHSGTVQGAEPLVREGDVTIARWDRAARRNLPAESKFGADLRLELADGVVYSYDGSATRIVLPQDKKVLVVTSDKGAEDFITGNVVGSLILAPFIDEHALADLVARPSRLSYVGTRTLDGIECDVVEFRPEDTELFKNVRTTWSIGVSDHLPRATETAGDWSGVPVTLSTRVTRMTTDVIPTSDCFKAEAPTGFATEQFEPKPPPALLAAGNPAPEFTLRDGNGKPQSLADLRGEIVVLDFWGTWCGPCLMAMPSLQKLHQRFGDRSVRVFGVSCREPKGADPKATMARLGCTYGLLVDGTAVAEQYHVTSFPTLYVIGRDGKVVDAHSGYVSTLEQTLGDILERELARK
jgi:peroxiredoxin